MRCSNIYHLVYHSIEMTMPSLVMVLRPTRSWNSGALPVDALKARGSAGGLLQLLIGNTILGLFPVFLLRKRLPFAIAVAHGFNRCVNCIGFPRASSAELCCESLNAKNKTLSILAYRDPLCRNSLDIPGHK